MRFAINPLEWFATKDGWLDFSRALPLPTLLAKISEAGFDAIHADVPAGMDTAKYRAALAARGLVPAPGYLSMPLADADARRTFVEEAERVAAVHADLGLGELFVASNMSLDAPRVLRPARGADSDPARLERIAESLQHVGEATRRHGVLSCLHPHVGTWIETEAELDWLLDRLDPEIVAFGPDTGHLAWAGADPVEIARRYRDRIHAVHIKDIRVAVAAHHRDDEANYREVVQDGLWVEPGRGDLDLRAILGELRDDLCTWGIIEVDSPDLPTPEKSVAASAAWARDAATSLRAVAPGR
jgi:inosose dehydratase